LKGAAARIFNAILEGISHRQILLRHLVLKGLKDARNPARILSDLRAAKAASEKAGPEKGPENNLGEGRDSGVFVFRSSPDFDHLQIRSGRVSWPAGLRPRADVG
jgi:hypothetical protein